MRTIAWRLVPGALGLIMIAGLMAVSWIATTPRDLGATAGNAPIAVSTTRGAGKREPGEPVFAPHAPADRGEPSVPAAIDRDDEPDLGPRHAEAVGDALWLDPGRLDLLAPELYRLHLGLDTLRPQMPRPLVDPALTKKKNSPRPKLATVPPPTPAAPPVADPGPAATGPRWPTLLVRARGEIPADWRETVFRGGQ